jgi:uncharacterized membrane protein
VTHAWATLPAQVPVHFGITGQPDKWESKNEIWVLPALSLLFYVGLTVLSRYAPKFNYLWEITPSNAERQYHLARVVVTALKAETIILLAVISWQSIRVALNQASDLGILIPAILVISSLTIATYLWLALRAS